jgi:hypothetical protein
VPNSFTNNNMPEQTESNLRASDQLVRRPTAALSDTPEQQAQVPPAAVQMKPTTRPAAKAKTPTDDRDDFIRNAVPVAAALRRSGKPEEAKKLELVASAILQTKSLERTAAPEQAQANGKEESIKDLLANVYKAIEQDPALKNMPEAKEMRRASNKLDKDGMLNITVRNGVVTSFVSNFTDNFKRTQQVEPVAQVKPVAAQGAPALEVVATPVPAAVQADDPNVKVATIRLTFNNPEEPGRGMPAVLSKRFQEAGASAEVLSTKPALVAGQSASEMKVSYRLDGPGIEKVSALLDAAIVMRGTKVQEMPGDPQARKEAANQEHERLVQQTRQLTPAEQQTRQNVFKPQVSAAQQIAPTPAVTVAQAAPGPQKAPSREEIIYSAAPPDLRGLLTPIVTSSHQAHYSIYQIQVDANDRNRAILLPAPGADAAIIAALHVSTETAYQVLGRPDASERFLEIQSPTRLERTPDGWKLVEKGVMGFSTSPSVYQAPQAVQVQQVAPQPPLVVAQGKAFSVADLPVDLLARVGVPVAELERTGQLQKLLDGKKTDLIPDLVLAGPDGQPTKFAAKLVLDRDDQGIATLRVDLPKHELVIPPQVMGKEITPAMQQQLKTTGIVPLAEGFSDGKGKTMAGYLAVDQEMKRVVYVRPEGLSVPKEVYGAKLTAEQQKSLLEGRPTRVEGMTHPGEKKLVDALVQLDPLKKAFVFRDTTARQVPEQVIAQVQNPPTRRQGVRM